MADEVVIVDIQYNTNDAEKEVEDLTKSIEGLRVEQGKLNKQLEEGEISQVEYSKQTAKLKQQIQGENKQRNDAIKFINAEEKSRDRLRLTINKLTKERNKLNTSTKEGAQRSAQLKRQIDELNDELKETGTALEAQRQNIGNYPRDLEAIPGPLGSITQGFKGMIAQAKAFIATPIGAILAAVAGAAAAFSKAIKRSEKATESFNKVGAAFQGVLNGMLEGLVPVVEFMGDLFVKAIEAPQEALKDLGNLIKNNIINRFKAFAVLGESVSKLLAGEFKEAAALAVDASVQLTTGVTDATDRLQKFGETVIETQKATIAAANAEREYAKAQIALEKTQLRLQNEAEKLRQIRDDESLTIERRIQANEKLGKTLDEQTEIEKQIAQENLDRALIQQKANGETVESIERIGEAEIKLLEIEERITGQRSEQLIATNALLKEQQEQRIADEQFLAQFEQELLQEQLAEEEEVRVNSEQIIQDKLNEINAEAAKGRIEIAKAEGAERRAIAKASIDFIGQLTNDLSNFLITSNRERLDKQLADERLTDKQKEKLERDFAKRQKRIAKLQALINGALAVTKILAEVPKFDFGISTGILIAAAVATTAAQVATIEAQKFAKGGRVKIAEKGAKFGTFEGASHAAGGIDLYTGSGQHVANVEGKEDFFVLNKKASSFINTLSAINQGIGGGVALNTKSGRMQDGGQADLQQGQGVSINDLTEAVIKRLPPIVVQTVDIKTGLEERNEVVNVGVV